MRRILAAPQANVGEEDVQRFALSTANTRRREIEADEIVSDESTARGLMRVA